MSHNGERVAKWITHGCVSISSKGECVLKSSAEGLLGLKQKTDTVYGNGFLVMPKHETYTNGRLARHSTLKKKVFVGNGCDVKIAQPKMSDQ